MNWNKYLKSFKNKKTPGSDDMNVELIKYAPLEIKYRFLELLNIFILVLVQAYMLLDLLIFN